ncbi:hypothetical protein P9139_21510 [Curtobacterium flaccumfaciens]|nr:hypothetical protein P9139_21510 [Curtobacterium flaccumfaciens]
MRSSRFAATDDDRSVSSSFAMSPRSIRQNAPISSPATSGVPVPATACAMSFVGMSAAAIVVMSRA